MALGVAILGSVVLAIFRRGMDVSALTPDQAHVAQGTLGGAVEVSKGMPAPQAEAFVDGAQAAFVDGMHIAAGATAIVLLITAILVARMLGRR